VGITLEGATVEWTVESNLYAQLQGSCTLGRDMGFQPGPHANMAQFENTDANRENVRDGHRSGERSASGCNQANSKSNIINKVDISQSG
jgi:hypothetical protein